MTDEKHLKNRSYYENRYDEIVVHRCRDMVRIYGNIDIPNEIQKGTKEYAEYERVRHAVLWVSLYCLKGELWKDRRSTIDKWMHEDEHRDKLLEKSRPPTDIYCTECRKVMINDLKTLDTRRGEDHVLFFYKCSNKHRGRAFYEDGEEYIVKPQTCIECASEDVEVKSTRADDIITTTTICNQCSNTDIDTFELNKTIPEEPEDLHFEEDRKKYCITDAEGMEYISQAEKLRQLGPLLEEFKEKEANQAKYQLIDSIERLSVPQIRERITTLLEQDQFSQIRFSEPIMKNDVQVTVTAEDSTNSNTYDREKSVAKLLRINLATTNWKLMNDGINSRMGVFTIRLRGFDNKDDVKKLVETRLKNGELEIPELQSDSEDKSDTTVTGSDGSEVIL